MFKKIVFINYERFSENICKRYFFEIFRLNGFVVEYWDVSLLIKGVINTSVSDYETIINSYDELEVKLKSDKDFTLFIPLFYLMGNSIRLYRLFKISNIKVAFFCWGMWPSVTNKSKLFTNLSALKNLINKSFYLNQFSKFLNSVGFLKNYDFVFAAGKVCESRFPKSNVYKINFGDYDSYLKIKNSNDNDLVHISGDYCVFLDNNAAFHPDVVLLGSKHIDHERYFFEINSFFERIEKFYGVEVVISAHPTSNYSTNIFNNRKIYKNISGLLVRDSKFVISSISTSISFAVMFRKPLLLFYTQEMTVNYYNFGYPQLINLLGGILNCSVTNISINYSFDKIIKEIQNDIRDKFLFDFYSSEETQNVLTEELLFEYINGIEI